MPVETMRPRHRQRRSFGGKGGVWWRNKEAVREEDPKKGIPSISRNANNTLPQKHEVETTAVPQPNLHNCIEPIGWDEELCRPIYPTILPLLSSPVSTLVPDDLKYDDSIDRRQPSNRNSKATPSSNEFVLLPFKEDGNKENTPTFKSDSRLCSKKKKEKARAPKRTRQTFGNKRKPPPLSLLLENTTVPSSPTDGLSERKKHKSSLYSPASEIFDTEHTEGCRLDSLHHRKPRRVSTSPLSEKEEESSSTDGCNEESPMKVTSNSSPSTVAEFSSSTPSRDIFAFDEGEDEASPTTMTSMVHDIIEMEPSSAQSSNVERPSATSSLDKVNDYFAHLDNVPLTIVDQDEESSPSHAEGKETYGSSRVIRTSRKISYKNETLQGEYSDYVRGTEGTGVSPLSITKYAKSRGDHFRKKELYDGFLEEE